jgi:hypothetical protein
VQYAAQEPLSCSVVAPLLDQDVEYDTVLVDGPPQPVAFAIDLQEHLFEMPFVACGCPAAAQSGRVGWAKLGAPLTDRLVADNDAALSEEILNITKAEVEAEIEPDSGGRSPPAGSDSHGTATPRVGLRPRTSREHLSIIIAQLDNSNATTERALESLVERGIVEREGRSRAHVPDIFLRQWLRISS